MCTRTCWLWWKPRWHGARLTCISTTMQPAHVTRQWPYSYDSCDVGTLPNQTYPGTSTPLAAIQNGDPSNNNVLVCCLGVLARINDSFVMTSHFFQGNVCVCSLALTISSCSNCASLSCMYMFWRVSSWSREFIRWKISSRN